MLQFREKDEYRKRLENLSKEIKLAKDRFHRRGHKANGVHMSNLVNIAHHQKELDEKIAAADENLWKEMKKTWHMELEAMLDSFSKIIEYEDEEFRKNSK